jgi:oligopeptide transport system permease protein
MLRFIVQRVLQAIPVLFILATVTFFMLRLAPGGPFDKERKARPEIIENMNKHFGLDKPLWEQYLIQMKNLLRGDLGPSYKYPNRTVNELIAGSFPVSLELGCYALIVALSVGILSGIIASLRPNTASDYIPMAFAMVGICLPTFVIGPLLSNYLGLKLGWFNPSGWFFPEDRVLPAITLGFYYAAYISRLTRGGMLDILNQDFIRTARAKGASTGRIVFHHALKGGLLPTISFLGPAVAGLLTGSFVVEKIF